MVRCWCLTGHYAMIPMWRSRQTRCKRFEAGDTVQLCVCVCVAAVEAAVRGKGEAFFFLVTGVIRSKRALLHRHTLGHSPQQCTLRKPWQPFNGLSQSNRFRALTMDPGTKPDSSCLIVQNLCVCV